MLKFSANLGLMWAEQPLLEQIASAAKAGFKAVELHFPYDVPAVDVKAACASAGVKLLGINTALGEGADGHRGLGAVPGQEEAFKVLALQALDYAHAASGTAVHIMAGLVAPADHERAEQTFVANLKWASKEAAERGLTIFLEPLNTRDMPGYFYSRVEQAVQVIDLVGENNVKLMFDTYHIGAAQGDILTRLDTLYDKIGHIQIAAVPSRHEPDEGEIAYGNVLQTIDAKGYDGWIGCEYKSRGDTDEGLVWMEKLGFSL